MPHAEFRLRAGGWFGLARCSAVAVLLAIASGCGRPADEAGRVAAAGQAPVAAPSRAVIATDHGIIEFELLADAAPKTVENFRLLANRGFYDGLTFHRIVKGFMIQGGDPLGDGRGGESAWGGKFDDEIKRESALYDRGAGYRRGIVAMANAGPNTNGSQFFIIQRDRPMAPGYTIFGRVTKGIEVVDALIEVPTQRGVDGGMSKPVAPPVMRKVRVVDQEGSLRRPPS